MTRLGTGALVALVLVTLLSFALRMTGLDKLQPHVTEPDPGMITQLQLMRAGVEPDPSKQKSYLAYPTLLAHVVATLPRSEVPESTPTDELLDANLAMASADVVWMRTAIALLAALLAPATWFLARRSLSPTGAFVAAALVALSVLHLLFSQQARPHGAHATFALLAVLCHMRTARDPSPARLALSALACAAAIGVLHTGVFTLPPLAVALWLAARSGKRFSKPLAAATLLPSALAALFLYPRAPKLETDSALVEFGGHTLKWEKLDGSGFRTIVELMWNYEPALWIALLVGGVLWIAAARRAATGKSCARFDLWIAAAYVVPYVLALGVFGETFDRFLLPLLPYFAVLAASLVERVKSSVASYSLAAVLLAFPAWVVARYVSVRSQPDTIEQAAAWIAQNATPGADAVLTTPALALPLFNDDASLEFAAEDAPSLRRPWIQRQRDVPPPQRAELARYGLYLAPGSQEKLLHLTGDAATAAVDGLFERVKPRFVVLAKSRLMANFPSMRALRAAAEQRGELVATIFGEAEGEQLEPPLDYNDIPRFTPRILSATAFGPCLEIFRIRAE